LRTKRAELERALEGRVREHHRFLIARHLIHIDFLACFRHKTGVR
jgi:transposase